MSSVRNSNMPSGRCHRGCWWCRPAIRCGAAACPGRARCTCMRGADKDDWIVEGLAEYYSIELPRRAGLLSASRAKKAWAWMQAHGSGVRRLHTDHSDERVTARAVTLFAALDAELRAADARHGLDDVVRRLIPQREVSREALRDAARAVLGAPSQTLQTPLLD